jgi:hypothetical protein
MRTLLAVRHVVLSRARRSRRHGGYGHAICVDSSCPPASAATVDRRLRSRVHGSKPGRGVAVTDAGNARRAAGLGVHGRVSRDEHDHGRCAHPQAARKELLLHRPRGRGRHGSGLTLVLPPSVSRFRTRLRRLARPYRAARRRADVAALAEHGARRSRDARPRVRPAVLGGRDNVSEAPLCASASARGPGGPGHRATPPPSRTHTPSWPCAPSDRLSPPQARLLGVRSPHH